MVERDTRLGAQWAPDRGRSTRVAGLTFAATWRTFAVYRVARPHHAHSGTAGIQIDDADHAARLFDQGLGDEEAESHAFVLLQRAARPDLSLAEREMAGPRRDVGLADTLEDVGRKAGSVVGDGDAQLTGVPARLHADLALGEVGGIFDDVAQTVEQFR